MAELVGEELQFIRRETVVIPQDVVVGGTTGSLRKCKSTCQNSTDCFLEYIIFEALLFKLIKRTIYFTQALYHDSNNWVSM